MVAFRVRPRQLRRPRPHSGALIGRGHQKSHAIATLAAQSGALSGIGHQKSHAIANLFYARGHQKSHARATPAILGLGRQKSHAIATLGGGGGGFANGYRYRALVEIAPQPDLSGTLANYVHRLPADVLAATGLRAAAGLDPGASSAYRPFAATAAWNVPATALGVDPASPGLCSLLWNGASPAGTIKLSNTDYSFPVYYAAAGGDPHATSPLANDNFTVSCVGKAINGTLIPWNAAWTLPAGTDAQVIVLDPATGREWDLWQVSVNAATKVVTCANGTVLASYLTGNGQNLPSRGTGLEYLAMLARPWEVTQGRIDHALAMGIINVGKTAAGAGTFVGPAIKSDGDLFGVVGGIPEGTRFALDVTDAQIATWAATLPAPRRAAATVIAKALREYGWVITDHAGAAQLYLEDRASAGAGWDALGLTNDTTTTNLLAGLITATNFHAVVPSPYPATGGLLQSFAGGLPADVRLEPYGAVVGAGKLDHQFVGWDGAGALDLRVRLPSWDVTTPYRLWLYAGKAALSATEENPGGLWQGAMRATRLDTGADLSGGTRTLPPSGVTAGGTLAGMPAGRFVAASYCRKSSPAYVPHLTAVTNEIVFQLDAAPGATDSGDLDRVGGTPLSAETHSRYSSFIYNGGKISAGANWYDAPTARQTNESVETAAGVVAAALVHCMAVRQSGQATAIYVNGASVPVTAINPPATGYLNVLANDEDTVGAGQGAQTTALPGLYALDVQWPAALSAAFVAMRYRSEVEGRSVAGMGGFDAFGDADQGPVAVPLRATNPGAQADYDVVLGCFDPDTPADPITLTAVGASSHAGDVASLTLGKVRYKPQPGWAGGTAEVPFTIGDGRGKASSSRLWLAVSPSLVVIGNEGLAPSFPASTATIKGPVAASAVQATYNALTAPEIAGGVTILVTPGTSTTGGLTLNKNGVKGTGADDQHPQFPIIIRPGTLSGGRIVDPASFPAATFGGAATFSGSYNWLRGVNIGGTPNAAYSQGRGNRLNRCKLTSQTDDYGASGSWDWCEWTGYSGVMHQFHPLNGSTDNLFYRNHLHDDVGTVSPNGVFMQLGNNPDFDTPGRNHALECLFGPNPGGITEACEMKSRDNILERCSAVAAPGTTLRFNARQSSGNHLLALRCTNGFILVRGPSCIIADCVASGTVGPATGNYRWANWVADKRAGRDVSGKYPEGLDTRVIRVAGPSLGYGPSGNGTFDWPIPPTNTTVEACSGTTTRLNGTLLSEVHTQATTSFPARTDSGAIVWATTQVGPNGVWSPSD